MAQLKKQTEIKEAAYEEALAEFKAEEQKDMQCERKLGHLKEKLKKAETDFNRAAYLEDDYFGRYMFNTELAAVERDMK